EVSKFAVAQELGLIKMFHQCSQFLNQLVPIQMCKLELTDIAHKFPKERAFAQFRYLSFKYTLALSFLHQQRVLFRVCFVPEIFKVAEKLIVCLLSSASFVHLSMQRLFLKEVIAYTLYEEWMAS